MKYTFVITYDRAGSGLLLGILNSIQGWSIRGNNNNFTYHFFKSYQALEKARNKDRNKSTVNTPWPGYSDVNLDVFRSQIALMIKQVLQDGVGDHAMCCGFKETGYLDILQEYETADVLNDYIDFLVELLGNTKIIFLTRDPDKTCNSGLWARNNSLKLRQLFKRFTVFSKSYCCDNPHISFHITYEDIVERSERLDGLFVFLGVKPKKADLQQALTKPYGEGHRTYVPTVLARNSGSPKWHERLNEADRLYALGKREEAKLVYQDFIALYKRGEATILPFHAAVRAGYQAFAITSSREYALAYFPMPKCACTSVSHLLYDIIYGHPFARDYRKIHGFFWSSAAFSLDHYKDHYKFTVVRDPIERFVSGYCNRILFHKDLHPLLYNRGEQETALPSINDFALNLEEYLNEHLSVANHFQPLRVRLSDDLSIFDAVYPIENLDKLTAELSNRCGRSLRLGRYQDGGPKKSIHELSPDAFDKLLNFYAQDYEILADYYPFQRIKDNYYGGK